MDWRRHGALSREWIEKTRRFVSVANEYVTRGIASEWKAPGEEPEDPRTAELGARVLDVVREANEAGAWRELRARFPPAHRPFHRWLDHRALAFRSVRFVDDRRVVAAAGAPRSEEALVVDFDGEVAQAPGGALEVGSSPDRRYFALLYENDIVVTAGWAGAEIGRFPRPRGDEDAVAGVATIAHDAGPAPVDQIVVMPDGGAVALATSYGVFLTSPSGIRRVSPDRAQLAAQVAEGSDDEPCRLGTDMTHVAIHPSGELIACGHQLSQHELRAPDGTLVAAFGPVDSEYPHHAAFSPDGELAIFNSCHFYDGATTVARVEDLRGLRVRAWQKDGRLPPLEGGARVYASSFHDGSFLLGDANGYVIAVRPSGAIAWHQYVGGSITGLDVSPDGRRLAVGTYSGFLALLEIDDERDPFQRGDGPFRERIRYVRCRGEQLWRW